MGYFETELSAGNLTSTSDFVRFSGDFSRYNTASVFTIWVETADGSKSTSSVFQNSI